MGGAQKMKRLIPGMFSSIPDAEFITSTLNGQIDLNEEDQQRELADKPAEPRLPDVGGDDWLPS